MGAILLIRGQKVMLDEDLARLYVVPTKALNQAVTRNAERFLGDFMFQLTRKEFDNLRSQVATSSLWGGRWYPPRAFTEQGVAMLSSVLRSRWALRVGGVLPEPLLQQLQSLLEARDNLEEFRDQSVPGSAPRAPLQTVHQGLQRVHARNIATMGSRTLPETLRPFLRFCSSGAYRC